MHAKDPGKMGQERGENKKKITQGSSPIGQGLQPGSDMDPGGPCSTSMQSFGDVEQVAEAFLEQEDHKK